MERTLKARSESPGEIKVVNLLIAQIHPTLENYNLIRVTRDQDLVNGLLANRRKHRIWLHWKTRAHAARFVVKMKYLVLDLISMMYALCNQYTLQTQVKV